VDEILGLVGHGRGADHTEVQLHHIEAVLAAGVVGDAGIQVAGIGPLVGHQLGRVGVLWGEHQLADAHHQIVFGFRVVAVQQPQSAVGGP